MASLTIANEIKAKLADDRRSFLNGCYLCLYQVSHSASASNTLSTMAAIEADFAGYSRHLITEFSAPGYLNSFNNGEIDATNITFNCTGSSPSNTIYGYFIIDPTQTYLVCQQDRAAGGVLIDTSGQTYVVALVWLVEQGS